MSGGATPTDPRGSSYTANAGAYCYKPATDNNSYEVCARLEGVGSTVAEQTLCLPTEASTDCDTDLADAS